MNIKTNFLAAHKAFLNPSTSQNELDKLRKGLDFADILASSATPKSLEHTTAAQPAANTRAAQMAPTSAPTRAKIMQNIFVAQASNALLSALSDDAQQNMRKSSELLGLQDTEHAELLAHHAAAFASKNTTPSRYSEAELAQLRAQTDAFEAFFIKSVLDIAMPRQQNPLFGKDAGDEIYRDMHHDAISRALSGGMGLSEILYQFLKDS